MIEIRQATMADAEAVANVLQASITQLCETDHKNDEYTLTRWLRNKTPETVAKWIAREDNFLVVAVRDGGVCGVGAITRQGSLDLCYVQPTMQSHGVGLKLLTALEEQARQWGLPEIRLVSTSKARSFYEKHGYVADGEPTKGYGVLMDYKYVKTAQPGAAPLPSAPLTGPSEGDR
jgi:N-acetylglutamate synthase-like GNAT family acetyltransferase